MTRIRAQTYTHTPANSQMTHSKAQLGNVHVELGRVEVNEAEQCSKYPWPPLAAPAEHVRLRQGAVETVTQITQAVDRALGTALHRRQRAHTWNMKINK